MKTYSAHDLDKGIEYLRLEHELTANIKATDQVTFELAFTAKNDPWTNKLKLSEDVAVCKLVQSSQKKNFWTQTSEDKYYSCSGATSKICILTAITQADGAGTFTANNDGAGLDWTNPLPDDDEEAPYCTPHSDTTFACKKIKCIQQRKLVTNDQFDFNFTPTATAQDAMYIRPGRALLGLNRVGCTASNCLQTLGNFQT